MFITFGHEPTLNVRHHDMANFSLTFTFSEHTFTNSWLTPSYVLAPLQDFKWSDLGDYHSWAPQRTCSSPHASTFLKHFTVIDFNDPVEDDYYIALSLPHSSLGASEIQFPIQEFLFHFSSLHPMKHPLKRTMQRSASSSSMLPLVILEPAKHYRVSIHWVHSLPQIEQPILEHCPYQGAKVEKLLHSTSSKASEWNWLQCIYAHTQQSQSLYRCIPNMNYLIKHTCLSPAPLSFSVDAFPFVAPELPTLPFSISVVPQLH